MKFDPNAPAHVLASGIDTLEAALDVKWESVDFFASLAELKAQAKATREPVAGEMISRDEGVAAWRFRMLPYGTDGYEWMLHGRHFNLKIGNWLTARSRPSIMVDFRSEGLWSVGPAAAVARLEALLRGNGGHVESCKASRADPTVDILLADSLWSESLKQHCVTRARVINTHDRSREFTGLSIGKGQMHARIYDKLLEIETKSPEKVWMFDIWNTWPVPDGYRVVRVELQLRRTALKDLGLSTVAQLLGHPEKLWAYCTSNWLKLQNDASLHHTQQTTLPFWTIVQNGFAGAQGATPLVRAKALGVTRAKLLAQLRGLLQSVAALSGDERLASGELFDVRAEWAAIGEEIAAATDDATFTKAVHDRAAKYHDTLSKHDAARAARNVMGLSLRPTPEGNEE